VDGDRGRGADEASFRAFVVARSPALARAAYLLTGDRHLAEDLLQTALLETAVRWRRVSAAGDPEPYVRRVLYTRHISWWRRHRHDPVLHGPGGEGPGREGQPGPGGEGPPGPGGGGPDGDAVGDGVARRLTVEQALARLTAKQRAVLVLRYFEDLTEVQAAAVLGCSPGTVKSQTRDALRRLRAVAPELADLVPEVTR